MNSIFKETFTISAVDEEGKRYFDGLQRLSLQSEEDAQIKARIDISSDLYKVKAGNTITLILADQLTEDGTEPVDSFYEDNRIGFVMCGTIFKVSRDEKRPSSVVVYISFGGLILELDVPYDRARRLVMDMRVYALLSRPNE